MKKNKYKRDRAENDTLRMENARLRTDIAQKDWYLKMYADRKNWGHFFGLASTVWMGEKPGYEPARRALKITPKSIDDETLERLR